MAALSNAATRRAQAREMRNMAHRFLQGVLSPHQVRERLTRQGDFLFNRATACQAFFASMDCLRKLWMQPWDRYAVKQAVLRRLATPGSVELGSALRHLRIKYGDDAVNHAIGEELALRTSAKATPALLRYTIKRKGVEKEIATLSLMLACDLQ